jgi:hypothetical protein
MAQALLLIKRSGGLYASPSLDESSDGIEWDCRVKLVRAGITVLHPLVSGHVVVYGKAPYSVVPVLSDSHKRKLSPDEESAKHLRIYNA